MGMIYKRTYKRRDGTTAEAAVWWIKYYRNGVPMRESSGSEKEGVAKSLLRTREGDIERGLPITPRTNRATFDDLAADVLNDYKVNGKRSLGTVTYHFAHLKGAFKDRRAAGITPADVRAYILRRQEEKAANATINRELAMLKRCFTLGMDAGKVTQRPKIALLREDNVRTGFFERELFEAVRTKLAEPLRPLATFAYITGWRIHSEALPLQWRHVDFEAGTVRLDPGTTKNGEGRLFPMTHNLRALLEAQRATTEVLQLEKGIICPWVFHRDGKQIKTFKRNWKTACKLAGCPGMIPHDFRRTAVRTLVRAGIPERVAMTMTGHKTRSVFERYNIVSPGDLIDAAHKLDIFVTGTVAGTVGGKSARGSRGA
jgi:integrase